MLHSPLHSLALFGSGCSSVSTPCFLVSRLKGGGLGWRVWRWREMWRVRRGTVIPLEWDCAALSVCGATTMWVGKGNGGVTKEGAGWADTTGNCEPASRHSKRMRT